MIERKPTPLLQRIFDLRKRKKINLTQLGEVMGVKKGNAGAIENGDVPLKSEYLPAIAKLLGVEPWELFVDYSNKEVGPLSDAEKVLIYQVRQIIPKEKDRLAIVKLMNQLMKK